MSPGRSNKPLFEVLSEHPPKGPLSSSLRGTIPGRESPTPANPQTTPASSETAPKAGPPESAPGGPEQQPDKQATLREVLESSSQTSAGRSTAAEQSHADSSESSQDSKPKPADALTPQSVAATGPSGQPSDAATAGARAQVEAKPTRRVELQPKPQPESSSHSEAPDPSADLDGELAEGDQLESARSPRPIVTIPLSTVYTAIAFAGVLVLVAWIGGYKIGFAGSERQMINDSLSERPSPLTEPNGSGTDPFGPPMGTQTSPIFGGDTGTRNTIDPTAQAANPPGVEPEQPAGTDPNATRDPTTQPVVSRANGTILAAQGLLVDDPREAGLNYLELGTFSREMTADAIEFMATAGQPAIGIPQSGGRFRLISIGLAIPGSEWSAMRDRRSAHQRAIAAIGSDWVRERQGGSDFTQTQWTKYAP